jgi:hypothetical protein
MVLLPTASTALYVHQTSFGRPAEADFLPFAGPVENGASGVLKLDGSRLLPARKGPDWQ